MDPLAYCRNKVAAPGTDLYYALLFAAPETQSGLLAVHAFMEAVNAIPHTVADAGVASVKLNWWREELGRAITGEGRHPVTQLLTPAMAQHKLSPEPFKDMLEGAAMDLEYGLYPTFSQLSVYGHRTSGSLAQLLVRICGYHDPETVRYAHDVGMGLGLCNLLRHVRAHADTGRCYIPEDELQLAGLTPDMLQQRQSTPAIRQLFRSQAERVETFFQQAQQRLPSVDRKTQRFTLVHTALCRALLAEMAAEDYPLLERGFELTPIRKLWIAWRTARRNRQE